MRWIIGDDDDVAAASTRLEMGGVRMWQPRTRSRCAIVWPSREQAPLPTLEMGGCAPWAGAPVIRPRVRPLGCFTPSATPHCCPHPPTNHTLTSRVDESRIALHAVVA